MVLSGVESDEPKLDSPGPVNYKREDYIEEDENLSDTDSENEWEKPRGKLGSLARLSQARGKWDPRNQV